MLLWNAVENKQKPLKVMKAADDPITIAKAGEAKGLYQTNLNGRARITTLKQEEVLETMLTSVSIRQEKNRSNLLVWSEGAQGQEGGLTNGLPG